MHSHLHICLHLHETVCGGAQAFINTARKIYEKIEQGIFDVSNEVRTVLTHVSERAGCLQFECREVWQVSVSEAPGYVRSLQRRLCHSLRWKCVARSHMESRWVTERAGRLETQCALERPPLQRAALAAEAAERQMWSYLPCCGDTPSPDQRGRPHREHLQLEQQRGFTGSALCPRSLSCCSCCYWSTWPALPWLEAAHGHEAM